MKAALSGLKTAGVPAALSKAAGDAVSSAVTSAVPSSSSPADGSQGLMSGILSRVASGVAASAQPEHTPASSMGDLVNRVTSMVTSDPSAVKLDLHEDVARHPPGDAGVRTAPTTPLHTAPPVTLETSSPVPPTSDLLRPPALQTTLETTWAAAWEKAQALGHQAMDEFMHGNSQPEIILGVVLFGCMYALGWIDALGQAEAAARVPRGTPGEAPLDAVGIAWILCVNLASMWLLVLVMAVALLVLEKLLVAALNKTTAGARPDALLIPLGLRIAFAWFVNPRILVCIALSLGLTLAFGVAYLAWLDARRAGPAARVPAVRHIFVFNLACLVALLWGQVWLDGRWSAT